MVEVSDNWSMIRWVREPSHTFEMPIGGNAIKKRPGWLHAVEWAVGSSPTTTQHTIRPNDGWDGWFGTNSVPIWVGWHSWCLSMFQQSPVARMYQVAIARNWCISFWSKKIFHGSFINQPYSWLSKNIYTPMLQHCWVMLTDSLGADSLNILERQTRFLAAKNVVRLEIQTNGYLNRRVCHDYLYFLYSDIKFWH